MSPLDDGMVDYDELGRPRPEWGDRKPAYAVAHLDWDPAARRPVGWVVKAWRNRDDAATDYRVKVDTVFYPAVVLIAVAADGTVVPMQDCFSPCACRRVNGSRHLYRWDLAADLAREVVHGIRDGLPVTYGIVDTEAAAEVEAFEQEAAALGPMTIEEIVRKQQEIVAKAQAAVTRDINQPRPGGK